MEPPTDPKAELAAALVESAVSAIPIAGGVISEVGNLYLNPLEKRKQVWMNEVCRYRRDSRPICASPNHLKATRHSFRFFTKRRFSR